MLKTTFANCCRKLFAYLHTTNTNRHHIYTPLGCDVVFYKVARPITGVNVVVWTDHYSMTTRQGQITCKVHRPRTLNRFAIKTKKLKKSPLLSIFFTCLGAHILYPSTDPDECHQSIIIAYFHVFTKQLSYSR